LSRSGRSRSEGRRAFTRIRKAFDENGIKIAAAQQVITMNRAAEQAANQP
jgi:small-conductance mechanosensitive channel